jgi:DNA-directed RNA polymerase subunit L
MTDPSQKTIGKFRLENTTSIIANTLIRCILSETRSAGFRADLTDPTNPGVQIRKNTSVIFNEMLAHRLTLVPLGVRNLDTFDPSKYECILSVKNDEKGLIDVAATRHVTASDFVIREKQEDGSMQDLPAAATAALFPSDPITGATSLLVSLRPQWNSEQPPEEIDLTAYPVIGRGRDFMGFCPVSQATFQNTLDDDPVRREQFFHEWLDAYKKVKDPASLNPEALAGHRKEWETMAIQRCFLVGPDGEPNSFDFTIESVGIRPVVDIVAEGIKAVIDLVTPYTNTDVPLADLGLTSQPLDSRMNGVSVHFDGQGHTLGVLLQALITELYLDSGAADSPITYVGYKIRHPLYRVMTMKFGIREGVAGDPAAVARQVIATAANKARQIYEELGRAWAALQGGEVGVGGEATAALEG